MTNTMLVETRLEETWKPEHTVRARQIWEAYQSQNDLSNERGKVAAIDPESGRVWIDKSGAEIAKTMRAEGVKAPVYLVRVGSDYFVQKGRR